jgi:RNA polymerase sigma factor (sigma-70 family)
MSRDQQVLLPPDLVKSYVAFCAEHDERFLAKLSRAISCGHAHRALDIAKDRFANQYLNPDREVVLASSVWPELFSKTVADVCEAFGSEHVRSAHHLACPGPDAHREHLSKFAEFYASAKTQSRPALCSKINCGCDRDAVADDILQNAAIRFESAYLDCSVKGFYLDSPLWPSYFRTTLKHLLTDHGKSRHIRSTDESDEQNGQTREKEAILTGRLASADEVIAAIETLAEKQRQYLQLRGRGYTNGEIATFFGVREDNVKKVVSDGRRNLSVILGLVDKEDWSSQKQAFMSLFRERYPDCDLGKQELDAAWQRVLGALPHSGLMMILDTNFSDDRSVTREQRRLLEYMVVQAAEARDHQEGLTDPENGSG